MGDTVSRDIIGSKRAGFAKAIQICSQLTREKDCGVRREFEPDYMVEDIYDVLPILRASGALCSWHRATRKMSGAGLRMPVTEERVTSWK